MQKININVDFISLSCNCTYNCLELTENYVLFGGNYALVVYSLEDHKILKTSVHHNGRINCVRFIKNSGQKWILTCAADGAAVLWKYSETTLDEAPEDEEACTNKLPVVKPYLVCRDANVNMMTCDGIVISDTALIIGCITSKSKIEFYHCSLEDTEPVFVKNQIIDLKSSICLDLAFHQLNSGQIVLGIGKDSGAVMLYSRCDEEFKEVCVLRKHEDWVRTIAFCTLENGETLLASGGQDSFIAVWRFRENNQDQNKTQQFEFQSYKFQDYNVLFDSMIIGHEGWITSLDFDAEGRLLSCSSDQSMIVWSNTADIWTEEARLGAVGGETPGGFGAKFNSTSMVSWGFQGAIQIWKKQDDEWLVQPSVTGHFGAVTDLDYHPDGHFLVTTSRDQTTRVFAPWDFNWHEISRPQIHGHDIFAVKCCGDYIISGAEEKILRVFQPTQVFIQSLLDVSDISVNFKNVAECATLPALGLSNQSSSTAIQCHQSIENELDEDFLRSQTLWPEINKCYGHVYEISCLAASTKRNLVASASQSTKPQFAAIILWDANTWEKLGDYPFHKLNVTDMEFTNDGSRLLSVSRDRTWAVWEILKSDPDSGSYTMKLLSSDGYHTRAVWVGTWKPNSDYFVTGARDKKLALWKSTETQTFERVANQSFESSVSAAAINEDDIIAIGLESGHLIIAQYKEDSSIEKRLELMMKLNNSAAHHGTIERLRFNLKEKYQLASGGADRLVKIYQIMLC